MKTKVQFFEGFKKTQKEQMMRKNSKNEHNLNIIIFVRFLERALLSTIVAANNGARWALMVDTCQW